MVKLWLELRQIAAGQAEVLPKPGSGGTPARFAALADWAAHDLSLARLVEGHVDALAILAEAGKKADPGAVYGVWAARQPVGGTTASHAADGWHLKGTKSFCSGSTRIDRALVTAECEDGYRLFDVSVAENVKGRPCRVVARCRNGRFVERDPRVRRAASCEEPSHRATQLLPRAPWVLVRCDRSRRVLVRRHPRSCPGRVAQHRSKSIGALDGRARTCGRPRRPHAPSARFVSAGD